MLEAEVEAETAVQAHNQRFVPIPQVNIVDIDPTPK
jgi:hypothetical protein